MADENTEISDVVEALDEVSIEELDKVMEAIADPDKFYAQNTFRVVYQTNAFLVPQLRDLVAERQIINIRPEYQRRLRWTLKQKSRLIESLLLNIPIPSVFFFENEAARYEVMDGQQRLNAIKEFLNNEFKLASLEVLWPINGFKYADLPPRIKRGLERAVVTATVLLLESDGVIESQTHTTSIRRFIFERLNTGGTRLNPQELRNAVYPGEFNDMIIKAARDSLFTRVWGIPAYTESDPNDYYENPKRQKNSLYASMADCQIVLRFFALRSEKNIRGSMKGILDRTMDQHGAVTKDEAAELKKCYLDRLSAADAIFGGKPFALPPDAKGKVRLSIALHDAVMVALDRQWRHKDRIQKNAPVVRQALERALSDPEVVSLLIGKGNTANSIKQRIDLVEGILKQAAG